MQGNKRRISIGIDLGAKYTGVVIANSVAGEELTQKDLSAFTIVMPDAEKMTLSQAQRTAVRHRIRGKKRFNFARRLAMLLINEKLSSAGISLDTTEQKKMAEAVGGLLRRRGYARIESEINLDVLNDANPEWFAQHEILGEFFQDSDCSLLEQWENLTNKLENVRDIDNKINTRSATDFKKDFEELGKDEKVVATKAAIAIKDAAHNIMTQQVMGHKHRTKYLADLLKDLKRGDSRLKKVIEAFGSVERFHALIGNVSNLQLRAERWYFNAPNMINGDNWEPAKLQKSLVRAFKYFHPSQGKEENQRLLKLIAELENSEDILETLCTINPERTIPPYEDQNNRRPPLDQTLFLDPKKLTRAFQDRWTVWAKSFAKADSALEEGLDGILKITDRKSRISRNGNKPLPEIQYRFSYILQRVLDRSALLDPYAIRPQSYGEVLSAQRHKLELVLGAQHADDFLEFASKYYDEVADAKVGLWMPLTSVFLERADIHPPMKKKEGVLSHLVGSVLQRPEVGQKFIDEVWEKKLGRSSVRSICFSIETIRKKYGGDFNRRYRSALFRSERKEKLSAEEKEFVKLAKKVDDVSKTIADSLGFSETQREKFANPYSLAQLYTLIETERDGFTSVSVAAHYENNWRMQMHDCVDKDGNKRQSANCSRLPADSTRPFDGVVRRVIDRKAWEIAKRVAETIRNSSGNTHEKLEISCFVEENRFDFSASVADLKHNNKVRDRLQKDSAAQTTRWQNKVTRIKSANHLCPYTGKAIGANGEIDHIIPRSLTKKGAGTVFNAEANLIYTSQEGNQKKGNTRYTLKNLAPAYLKEIFGSDSTDAVEQAIEQTVQELQKTHSLRFFDLLSDKEQACVRHALFLSDASPARQAVLEMLANQNKTKVNGTQMWLVRQLFEKLNSELNEKPNYKVSAVSPEISMRLRESLGEINPFMKKLDVQPVASHSIDALCALAVGSDDLYVGERPLSDATKLSKLYPKNCGIIQIQRRPLENKTDFGSAPLFKDGIYSEKHLPIFTRDGIIYVGYASKTTPGGEMQSAVKVKGRNPEFLLKVLSPYFKHAYDGNLQKNQSYIINRSKALELLFEVAHQKTSAERQQIALIIESLTYCTKRTPVFSHIWDSEKGKLFPKEDVLGKKKFDINIVLSGIPQVQLKGTLSLPSQDLWSQIYSSCQEAFSKAESASKKERDKKSKPRNYSDEILNAINNFWNRPARHSLSHAPVHREFSLPVIDKPSGGFRICRETWDARKVVQIHAVNAKLEGFACNSGKTNWGNEILFPKFQSQKISAFGGRYSFAESVTKLSDWRQVLDGQMKVWLSPGSASRFNARIEAPFENVRRWLSAGNPQLELNSFLEMPSELKVADPKSFFSALPKKLQDVLNQPRNYIFFESIGDHVKFRFAVGSNTANIRDAYNKAGGQ